MLRINTGVVNAFYNLLLVVFVCAAPGFGTRWRLLREGFRVWFRLRLLSVYLFLSNVKNKIAVVFRSDPATAVPARTAVAIAAAPPA